MSSKEGPESRRPVGELCVDVDLDVCFDSSGPGLAGSKSESDSEFRLLCKACGTMVWEGKPEITRSPVSCTSVLDGAVVTANGVGGQDRRPGDRKGCSPALPLTLFPCSVSLQHELRLLPPIFSSSPGGLCDFKMQLAVIASAAAPLVSLWSHKPEGRGSQGQWRGETAAFTSCLQPPICKTSHVVGAPLVCKQALGTWHRQGVWAASFFFPFFSLEGGVQGLV